jgi:cell division septation protein DedD
MKITSRIKLTATVLSFVATMSLSSVAHAAGAATLSMSGGGNVANGSTTNISFVENSGAEAVNSVQVDLGYNAGAFQFVGFSGSAPFSCPIVDTSVANKVSVGCSITSNSTTGNQAVGTATFKALVNGGSFGVDLLGSSLIASYPAATDIWNHATSSSAYSFNPAAGGRGGESPAVAAQPRVLSATTGTSAAPEPAATPPVSPAPKKAVVKPVIASTSTTINPTTAKKSHIAQTIFSIIALVLIVLGAIAIANREKVNAAVQKMRAKKAAEAAPIVAAAAVTTPKSIAKKTTKPVAKKAPVKKIAAKKTAK